ncbi:hypothetical protein SPD48_15895 [Pseudogracilibacillus sp. SE30717A]|uniref:hypothetical protein n=1 Tax=Pseudogracilibacillus sp. SE30717A TaxID=3098293 RepID=UPI00300E27AF
MFKIKDVLKENIEITTSFIEEVNTYSISTEKMNDDCLPIRYSQSLMVWIDENGYIGEMESIFPVQTEEDMEFSFTSNFVREKGLPKIEVFEENKDIKVKNTKGGFILLFSDYTQIDKVIECEKVKFYCSNNFVIAIDALL